MEGDYFMDATKNEKFIDAGYTKQEIELLFKDPKVDPKPEDKPEGPAAENENSDNSKIDQMKSQTIPENEISATLKSLTDTVNSLTETVKAMQSANINNVTHINIDIKW